MATVMEDLAVDVEEFKRRRLADALTRLTLASDTDAVGITVDTDDLIACQQWLGWHPGDSLAYSAVVGASTATANKCWTARPKVTLPGRELTDYVNLLHTVHAERVTNR